MRDPDRVRQIVSSIARHATLTPVTVKCRIGVDGEDRYDKLVEFIAAVKEGGAKHVIVHARTCLLNGLNPAQNRSIPPLKYTIVHQLVRDFPDMTFCINGGFTSFEHADQHLNTTTHPNETISSLPSVHSVMFGRAAWHNPWMFRTADSKYFGTEDQFLTRREIIDKYLDYAEQYITNYPAFQENPKSEFVPIYVLIRPLQFLLAGTAGGRSFRRLTSKLYESGGGKQGIINFAELVEQSLAEVPTAVLDASPLVPLSELRDFSHVFEDDDKGEQEHGQDEGTEES
jgi:tRNA-dihydrouridine synthase A